MTFITPSSKIWDFFYVFEVWNFETLRFLRKVIVADLTFIPPSSPEKRDRIDFYNVKYSKITGHNLWV